jgi:thiol peroxidase
MATTKLKGNEVKLSGAELNVGDVAPIVNVVAQDLSEVQVGGQ